MRQRDRLIDAGLWIAVAVSLVITLSFSFAISAPGSDRASIADEAGHLAVQYVTSVCLLMVAVWRPGRGDGRFASIPAGAIAAVVLAAGLAIEVIQDAATRTRNAELSDVIVEAVGVLGALTTHAWFRRRYADNPLRSSCSR